MIATSRFMMCFQPQQDEVVYNGGPLDRTAHKFARHDKADQPRVEEDKLTQPVRRLFPA